MSRERGITTPSSTPLSLSKNTALQESAAVKSRHFCTHTSNQTVLGPMCYAHNHPVGCCCGFGKHRRRKRRGKKRGQFRPIITQVSLPPHGPMTVCVTCQCSIREDHLAKHIKRLHSMTTCPICECPIRDENLARHVERLHPPTDEDHDEQKPNDRNAS